MISLIRRCAAGLVVALGVSMPASAVTAGTDFTDLWFNPAESGWGVNLIQQNNIIFATLFVYGNDSSARWFVASNLQGGGTAFTGQLFQTTGPAFSANFNPAAVTATAVGTMTISFSSAPAARAKAAQTGATLASRTGMVTNGTSRTAAATPPPLYSSITDTPAASPTTMAKSRFPIPMAVTNAHARPARSAGPGWFAAFATFGSMSVTVLQLLVKH